MTGTRPRSNSACAMLCLLVGSLVTAAPAAADGSGTPAQVAATVPAGPAEAEPEQRALDSGAVPLDRSRPEVCSEPWPRTFASLPAGHRDVALHLYLAQIAFLAQTMQGGDRDAGGPGAVDIAHGYGPCPATGDIWSLEQIAVARLTSSGWGQVFHDMYRAGLLDLGVLAGISGAVGPVFGTDLSPSGTASAGQ